MHSSTDTTAFPEKLFDHLSETSQSCQDLLVNYLSKSSEKWHAFVRSSAHWTRESQEKILMVLAAGNMWVQEVSSVFGSSRHSCEAHLS